MFILREREKGKREREIREKMVEGICLVKNKFSYENILNITNHYENVNQNQKILLHTHYDDCY